MKKEQIEKMASECKHAASLGFVTHLKTAGVADDKIKSLHATYLAGTEKAAEKVAAMQDAILKGLGKA